MKRRGLTVAAQEEEFTVKVKAVHLAEACALRQRFDAVFLSVKSYDGVWAAQFIAPCLEPAGVLLPAQNGINEERVAPVIGYPRVLGCVVTLGAGLYEPGHVIRTSSRARPSLAVGELNGLLTPRVQELVELLAPLGPSRATANLWGERWGQARRQLHGQRHRGHHRHEQRGDARAPGRLPRHRILGRQPQARIQPTGGSAGSRRGRGRRGERERRGQGRERRSGR